MSLYWGDPWPSGVCDEGTQCNTYPLGEKCLLCEETITEGQSGTYVGTAYLPPRPGLLSEEPVHKECSFRSVMGGWGHHENHPYWCNLMGDPDGGLSKRESALKVWELFTSRAS